MAAAADQVVAIEDDPMAEVGFTVHWQNKFAENLGRFPAGPCAFLESELRTEAEYGDFMDWLWKEFPERSDILYQHSKSFHGVTEEQLAQHPPSAFQLFRSVLGLHFTWAKSNANKQEQYIFLIIFFFYSLFVVLC